MEFFDSHSHYNDEKFNGDREEIIKKTYEEGITKWICAGYDIPSSIFSVKLANENKFIYSICGISPNDVPENIEDIDKMISSEIVFYKIITSHKDKYIIRNLKKKINEIWRC